MPPKSFKADGTPKQRWSAADRSARGHGPRRRGGQPRSRAETNATGPAGDRERARAARAPKSGPDERPAKSRHPRPDRAEWPGRPARTHSSRGYSRTDGEERPRTDRPVRTERSARPDQDLRAERPARSERKFRTERSTRPDRDFRTDEPIRGNKPARGDRPVRDRSSWVDRPDRGPRPERERPVRTESAPWRAAADETPSEAGDFGSLGLPNSLVEQLRGAGITTPFPIQAATIPDALAGRDVLGRGQTGSGKTLAFGLPMITTLTGDGRIAAAGTGPGAHPRAGHAGHRRAHPAGPDRWACRPSWSPAACPTRRSCAPSSAASTSWSPRPAG